MITPLQFLRDVLPPLSEGGTYVYAIRSVAGNRTWFTNYTFNNPEELDTKITKENQEKLTTIKKEVFYTFAEYKDNIETGKFNKKTIHKKQNQACTFSVLAFDVDVGEIKPYKQQEEAIKAVKEALINIGISHYGIVSSGYGIHCYILLDDPISRGDWVSFSRKLAYALIAESVELDKSKAFDPAMLLRPVGALNKKRDLTKKVEILEWPSFRYTYTHIEYILSKFDEFVSQAPAREYDMPSHSKVDYATVATHDYAEIEQGCPQLAALAQNAEVEEPLWYSGIGVAAYCKDAEGAAIRWSENYSKYNKNEALRKLQQWRRVSMGPTTCARFTELNPLGCEGCKFKNKIKTPLHAKEFKKEITMEQTEENIKLPYGYYMKEIFGKTNIYKDVPDEDPVLVLDGYLMYVDSISLFYHERKPQSFIRIMYKMPFAEDMSALEVPINSINNAGKADSLINKLADAGVIVEQCKVKLVQDYIFAFAKMRQQDAPSNQIASQFGWTNENKSFIWGYHLFNKSTVGKVTAKNSSFVDIANIYRPHGTLEEWTKYTAVFAKETSHYVAFGFLLGFGSPLMKFTGLGGCLVNLYSPQSGSGKSTAGNYALSIYSDPKLTIIPPSSSDSYIFIKLGIINNMPMFIDEVSDWTPSQVSDIIYYASQGMERGRATKEVELRTSGTWNTIIITSSNQSLRDKLDEHTTSNIGQKQRLLEIPLDYNEIFDKYGKSINAVVLNDNFGVAGEVFLKHLVAMNADGELAELALRARESYEKEMNFEFLGEERFIAATIASTWLGAKIAQQIGIISNKIPLKEIFTKINAVVKRQRIMNVESQETAFDVVNEFINKNQEKIVKIRSYDFGESIGSCPDREVGGRIELWYKAKSESIPTRGIITVSLNAFKAFCYDTQRPYNRHVNELREAGINYSSHKGVLTSGITYTQSGSLAPKASVSCFSISIPQDLLDHYHIQERGA